VDSQSVTGIGRRTFLAGAAETAAGATVQSGGGVPRTADKSNCHRVLAGPMIPVITHYNRDLSLDLGALKANLEYLIAHGIRTGSGVLLIAGAGGDFPMLTPEERRRVIQTAVDTVSGRAPIVAGAQSTDQRVALELARFADEAGVYAVQISPAYYYGPSDADALDWVRKAADSVRHTGIMLYNTWWHGYSFPFKVLDTLMELDRVVSLKWSTQNSGLDFQEGIARYAKTVAVVDNALQWVVSAMLGATGFITHLGTVWPEFVVKVHGLLAAGKYPEAMEAVREKKWPWYQLRVRMANYTGGEAPPVRTALELCGRPGGPSRPPSRALGAAEIEDLRNVLRQIGAPLV
jgi:dihydrodipicolinate synthase/N-acetylneuraminate lyase